PRPSPRPSTRFAVLLAGGVLAATLVTPAAAQTTTATSSFQVTATVLKLCSVTATNLAFGDYTPTAASDQTSTLTVLCTTNTPYTIALNLGTAASATARAMTSAGTSTTLNYVLYRDASRTAVWGETTGTDTQAGTGTGTNQAITVYGRVPANQRPQPGSYTDTVTVTLTY
ncbi:spore coat U domain-containing protein, partial [Teichococcus deserti]|uniref:Csu type fimbrial protein n=1 Tax=Teichococcus deserti TaxID=1817963 RepID=UPI001A966641